MLGYVMADKPELKIKEYEFYRAYYCGVCKSIAARYGQLPRLALSYDFAFLALLLSSLDDLDENIEYEHCLIHHIKKIPVVRTNWAVDYAADMMVLLVYHNFLDDKHDEHKIRGTFGATMLKASAKRLSSKYPDVAMVIEEQLSKLYELEQKKTPSIDETGDTFATIMSKVFASSDVKAHVGEENARVLEFVGRNLGRWIYLADALDDVEKDIESGSYNPLLYRYEYDEQKENSSSFKARILGNVEMVLFSCLDQTAKSYNLLDVKKRDSILQNIIYSGLAKKSDALMGKEIINTEEKII